MPSFDLDTGLHKIRHKLAALEARTVDAELPRAAVVVPLCTRGGELAILFTKRSETVGTHKGQVSFPGGRSEPEDKTVVDTALRELEEELGVAAASVQVLGVFHEVISITNVKVTPVVAFLGEVDIAKLSPSAAEIDAVFSLTIAELTGKREVRPLRSGRPGPWYTAGPHPVWGLTAFILEEVLVQLLDAELTPLV